MEAEVEFYFMAGQSKVGSLCTQTLIGLDVSSPHLCMQYVSLVKFARFQTKSAVHTPRPRPQIQSKFVCISWFQVEVGFRGVIWLTLGRLMFMQGLVSLVKAASDLEAVQSFVLFIFNISTGYCRFLTIISFVLEIVQLQNNSNLEEIICFFFSEIISWFVRYIGSTIFKTVCTLLILIQKGSSSILGVQQRIVSINLFKEVETSTSSTVMIALH